MFGPSLERSWIVYLLEHQTTVKNLQGAFPVKAPFCEDIVKGKQRRYGTKFGLYFSLFDFRTRDTFLVWVHTKVLVYLSVCRLREQQTGHSSIFNDYTTRHRVTKFFNQNVKRLGIRSTILLKILMTTIRTSCVFLSSQKIFVVQIGFSTRMKMVSTEKELCLLRKKNHRGTGSLNPVKIQSFPTDFRKLTVLSILKYLLRTNITLLLLKRIYRTKNNNWVTWLEHVAILVSKNCTRLYTFNALCWNLEIQHRGVPLSRIVLIPCDPVEASKKDKVIGLCADYNRTRTVTVQKVLTTLHHAR